MIENKKKKKKKIRQNAEISPPNIRIPVSKSEIQET
jgi:hypothetical protein